MKIFTNLILLISTLLVGCEQMSKTGYVYRHREEPVNLDQIKIGLVEYYKSQYPRQLSESFQFALEKANGHRRVAIILDVAETVLSNWKYQEEYQFGFHYPTWKSWVDQGEAEAVPGIMEFYKNCHSRKYDIYLLTGRWREKPRLEDEPTVKNLHKIGFINYKSITFMDKNFEKNRGLFKKHYGTKIADNGDYDIVINIGDQDRDFWKHEKIVNIKLPNPFYNAPSKIQF